MKYFVALSALLCLAGCLYQQREETQPVPCAYCAEPLDPSNPKDGVYKIMGQARWLHGKCADRMQRTRKR